ncbi:MAG: beta-N-acetylglucosaminidase domain-containing protein [Actinomycetota bacterium]
MASWLGCIEGYYGTPYTHEQRRAFMSWMATEGLNVFAYAPKDDPFHRHRWREPYPDAELEAFADLAAHGKDVGVDFCFTISPGLDWADGDEPVLAEKLRQIAATGCTSFGVLWDDVPPGDTELGAAHAKGTMAALEGVGAGRWWTVGTDYALGGPTPYLQGLADGLSDDVTVAWTGPWVVPPHISGAETEALADAVGRKLLLWENFPVNDGPMGGVLHLGPYPARDPAMVDASAGVLFNTMQTPIASRIGVACGARFWRDPSSDREATWREVVASYPGLLPLAKASRSWVATPGPDEELVEWADAASADDRRLREFLDAGCRDGLDGALADEVGPWLDAWEAEAQAMQMCLDILERGYRSGPRGIAGGVLLERARKNAQQLFGIRLAVYPVMQQRGKETTASEYATAMGENLSDRLARRVLKAPT